ncbi:MAG: Cysteine protease (Fragment), partial [uncultured Sulfurovum sp.]
LLFFSSAVSETYYTGLVFDDEAYDNTPRSATLLTRDITFLPTSVSLEAYTPEVGSQGQTGTCTAWATAYGARTILESIAYNRMNRVQSTKNVFSPSYVYNQIRLKQGCKHGTYIHDALNLMKSEGVAKFNSFGFNCNKKVTYKDKQNALPYKIQDYKRLFARQSQNKVQLVKKALSQKKPVVIAMKIAKSFHKRAEDVWKPKQYEYQHISALGGHAMVIVGYDDNKDGGSFKLMNSWGKTWGENGFKWVRYQDFQYFVPYAYELITKPLPTKQVSLGGSLEFIGENGQRMNATYDKHRGIYVMNQSYYSGTRFNFIMTNKEPIYLYAFGLDALAKS